MDLDNLMGFLPLLIFVLTIVIDKSQRRKRRNNRGHFPPLPDVDDNTGYGDITSGSQEKTEANTTVYREQAADKTEDKPWYVEFPEDRSKKEKGRVFEMPKVQTDYKVYHEPSYTTAAALKKAEPVAAFKVPVYAKKPAAASVRMNRKRLRDGIIMMQILDKPRALKPYRQPY